MTAADASSAVTRHPEAAIQQRIPASIIYLVAVWIMATFASFRNRPAWELLSDTGLDLQVKFQAASWLFFGTLALWLLASGRVDLSLFRRGPLAWYAAFVGLALVSTSYSSAPLFTGFAASQLATALVLTNAMRHQIDIVYRLIGIYVAINWVLVLLGEFHVPLGMAWIAPAKEIYLTYGGAEWESWRFTSAFGHPSFISIVAAMGCIGLAARDRLRGREIVVIAWLALTVVLTVSRTAILGMVLGLVVVFWRKQLLLSALLLGVFAASLLMVVPYLNDSLLGFILRGQSEEDLASLTGRTDLYETALERIDRLALGDGFRSVRANLLEEENWGRGISHAHNLFLEALIGLGIPGVIAVTGSLISFLRTALRILWHPHRSTHRRSESDAEALAVFVPILAFCILDSGFAMNANPFVLVFIVFAMRAQMKLAELDGPNNRPVS